MRALFVGGVIDNGELDLDVSEPPIHYPPETGSGQSRYRLQAVGRGDDGVGCAVYGAPGLDRDEVMRVSDERDYARRFGVRLDLVE
ncbi:hypothetical protein QF205_04160 [Luteimonas composti]|uniref:Uncharacterized protein n=1 Tax=Luteimonas composti TaxID=398257 RepID=A0ABT6MQA1_9GAMM|nr:hypothetical protein [Luteimonas composti]MDH7452278.1 hypothetical protein [Luteimonas composti]